MEKEKVLIFRTAKMQVVDLLMEKIDKNDDLTFLVQPNVMDEIKSKFPYAKVISINDKYFNYASFCRNVKLKEKFDTVYVLASGTAFSGYEEVFEIIEHIKYKKLILFDGNGEEKVELHNVISIMKEYVFCGFAWLWLSCISIWYECFGKKYKF